MKPFRWLAQQSVRHIGARASVTILALELIAIIAFPTISLPIHRSFLGARKWTEGAFYGKYGTFFADYDGDGKADAIAVDDDRVSVRLSDGCGFRPKQPWTSTPFVGDLLYQGLLTEKSGTFFADVDGDRKADAIRVFKNKPIEVRDSKTTGRNDWTTGPFYGEVDTFFADVDGDERADAIAVNTSTVVVRRSVPSATRPRSYEFGRDEEWLRHNFSPGKREVFFANVTDHTGNTDAEKDEKPKADLILVKENGIRVWFSREGRFQAREEGGHLWTKGPVPEFFGTLRNPWHQATFFADVTGDGLADAIGVNDGTRIVGDDGIGVRESANIKNEKNEIDRIPQKTADGGTEWVTAWKRPGAFLSPDPDFRNWIWRNMDLPAGPWGYWTKHGPGWGFYGSRGTFFADVDSDGTADAIAVKEDGVWVRISRITDLPQPCPQPPPEGTLVKGSGPEVYQMHWYQRRWIPNLETFNWLGLDWKAVQNIDNAKLEAILRGPDLPSRANGTLLKGSGPAVWMMKKGERRWIVDRETFDRLRLDWDAVQRVDDDDLESIPRGEDCGTCN